MNEESKLIELFKKYPGIAAHAYGGHLLITTTKSNGKSKPRLLQLTKTMLQPLSIILPNIWRNNTITSLTAGQEMTNTLISMTTTRTNTQSITKN